MVTRVTKADGYRFHSSHLISDSGRKVKRVKKGIEETVLVKK